GSLRTSWGWSNIAAGLSIWSSSNSMLRISPSMAPFVSRTSDEIEGGRGLSRELLRRKKQKNRTDRHRRVASTRHTDFAGSLGTLCHAKVFGWKGHSLDALAPSSISGRPGMPADPTPPTVLIVEDEWPVREML